MYALVEAVDAYPEFIPWCVGSEVECVEEGVVDATLQIRWRGLRTRFTTRNRLTPTEAIQMALVDGPLKSLDGAWTFAKLGDAGARISLRLEFQLSGPLSALLRPFLTGMADSMVDAFTQRAKQVYGGKASAD